MITFVATPIGNLKDLTLRAIECLQEADVIYCEDTRHSIKLLNAYEIKKPLQACHKFNERSVSERILADSRSGKKVCIISDAGMPVISDPGNIVCQTLRAEGENYTVAPGANAFLSALILSALPADRFAFLGFLPDKRGQRVNFLKKYATLDLTLCFHVAPQDMDDVIAVMYEVFGDRNACAVREITKLHEEAIPFRLSQGLEGEKRGEYVLIVEGAEEQACALNELSVPDHIRHYMQEGLDKKEALKRVAKDRGVPKSELYHYTIDLEN